MCIKIAGPAHVSFWQLSAQWGSCYEGYFTMCRATACVLGRGYFDLGIETFTTYILLESLVLGDIEALKVVSPCLDCACLTLFMHLPLYGEYTGIRINQQYPL